MPKLLRGTNENKLLNEEFHIIYSTTFNVCKYKKSSLPPFSCSLKRYEKPATINVSYAKDLNEERSTSDSEQKVSVICKSHLIKGMTFV